MGYMLQQFQRGGGKGGLNHLKNVLAYRLQLEGILKERGRSVTEFRRDRGAQAADLNIFTYFICNNKHRYVSTSPKCGTLMWWGGLSGLIKY